MSEQITVDTAVLKGLLADVEQRISAKLEKIEDKVDHLQHQQAEMRVELARQQARLDEGNRRFSELEERVATLEDRERNANAVLAKLGVLAAGCGAAGGAIMKQFGI